MRDGPSREENMETVLVTLEIQMSEDPNEWDPASMGLPYLESDSGYDELENRDHAVAAMVKRAVVENMMNHDGHHPFEDVLAYYSDKSSENSRFSARYRLVESDWNDLEFKADMDSR
jgi:hypothetical protein